MRGLSGRLIIGIGIRARGIRCGMGLFVRLSLRRCIFAIPSVECYAIWVYKRLFTTASMPSTEGLNDGNGNTGRAIKTVHASLPN